MNTYDGLRRSEVWLASAEPSSESLGDEKRAGAGLEVRQVCLYYSLAAQMVYTAGGEASGGDQGEYMFWVEDTSLSLRDDRTHLHSSLHAPMPHIPRRRLLYLPDL